MKPAFSFEEIREVEKTIIEKDGIPSLLLMENAGKNAFSVIVKKIDKLREYKVYIICGKGNNAGDGFVAARHMTINNLPVTVVFASSPNELKGDALTNYEVLKQQNPELISFISFEDFREVPLKSKTLLIDAILGSGVKGKLSDNFEQAIKYVNKFRSKNKKVKVISLDVPSGLTSGEQGNLLINADYTITMGAVKTELLYGEGKENSGDIFVVPIGVDEDLLEKYNQYKKYFVGLKDVKELFPRRKKTSYKYSNGRALIIGGSKGLSGAVIMSSLSAMKSGAGAVIAAIPDSISSHFSRKLYDVIKLELDETDEGSIAKDSYDKVKKKIGKSDCVLIGPGLSLNHETKEFLIEVIKNCEKNLIIDADGLTLLAEDLSILLNRNSKGEIILTPHIGEFSSLSKVSTDDLMLSRFETVKDFSRKYNVNVVMKSETTLSCLKDGKIFINSTGNENLAAAGSGDVLSGIMVSLLAQSNDTYTAMICANYIHGMTADLYYEKYGNKQTARQQDLIKLIPKAVTDILN